MVNTAHKCVYNKPIDVVCATVVVIRLCQFDAM